MKLSALIAAAALLSGCTVSGGRCYPVLGLGWTVVNTNQPCVVRTKSTVIGLGLLTQPSVRCVLGYGTSEVMRIETNNVIVELK